MPAPISVRDLRKSYGKLLAVDGVTFAVERGELAAREQLRTFAPCTGSAPSADAMLGVVGLEDQEGTRTGKLSRGGQAQCLSIACALEDVFLGLTGREYRA